MMSIHMKVFYKLVIVRESGYEKTSDNAHDAECIKTQILHAEGGTYLYKYEMLITIHEQPEVCASDRDGAIE